MSSGDPRLAVSNIAWQPEEEWEVAALLQSLGVSSVEIAPTKVFADPTKVSERDAAAYVERWADHGVSVVAFQSMLFGRPDLALFESASQRRAAIDRLSAFIDLAGVMGVGVLVFGSPGNRRVPEGQTEADVWATAVATFAELGAHARAVGTRFCIEPNPVQYACNFVTTVDAGAGLVRDVDDDGFALHLDAAGMALAGDSAEDIDRVADILCHFHVSAPQLGPIEDRTVDHLANFRALHASGYSGTISIEMRPGGTGEGVARVRDAVLLTRDIAARAGLSL